MNTESPLDCICREAREHDAEILSRPDAYKQDEVEAAQLRTYQRDRLSVAAILRYE